MPGRWYSIGFSIVIIFISGVWCQYTSKDDVKLGMFNTMRSFVLEDPAFLDDLLAYMVFQEGNVHPRYGNELKYQRERRLASRTDSGS
jgi:hypothetical protein